MSTSVNLILRKDKAKPDGTCPVFLLLISDRRKRYVSTGVYILPKHWNPEKRIVRGVYELAPKQNARLKAIKLKADTLALEGSSALEIKNRLAGRSGSLTAYFEQFIAELDEARRFWDWKKYRVLFRKLVACFGDDIDWKDLDRRALVRFENHMREKECNGPNTIAKEMQRLRRVIRQAIKDGAVKLQDDPFVHYERPKLRKPNRRKLSMDEILLVQELDLPEDSKLREARDAFLVSFYGGGIRFGDLCCLKPSSVQAGKLQYRMLKTGNMASIPLPDIALRVLKPYQGSDTGYLFPFLVNGDENDSVHLRRRISSNNSRVNALLKKVADLAGIPKEGFSMHIARHSYADFARTQGGDLYAISKTLGHADLKTTEHYLKSLDQEAVDKLAETIWKT